MKVTLLTFNTFGVSLFYKNFYAKIKKTAEIINTKKPDILNFQEVVFYNHLNKLKELLPDFKYIIYKPSFLGPHAGLVTFSKIPLQYKGFQIFKKNGNIYDWSLIHVLARRGLLISEFDDKKGIVINTHFSSNMSNNWSEKNNYVKILRSQAQEISTLLKEENHKTYLISGDFNIPKKSNLYPFLNENEFINVFNDTERSTHLGDLFVKPDSFPTYQVDYIFASKHNVEILEKEFLFDQKFIFNKKKRIYL